jgi:hypothetical protein
MDVLNHSRDPDDQMIFNQVICAENISWKRFGLRNNKTCLTKYDIHIMALGDHLVSRKRPRRGLFAYHPFLQGGINEKLSEAVAGIRKILIR